LTAVFFLFVADDRAMVSLLSSSSSASLSSSVSSSCALSESKLFLPMNLNPPSWCQQR
jgi:ABC-type antimicrobial peptide transport system permease subunit